tara:strand:+ start:2833 stop:3879 length:1047 start_codon:yes stop_codon:yes gene_type:complete
MGERITFRGRGRGCIVLGANYQPTLTDPHVEYRRGWLTGGTDPADGSVEVGDRTEYPLEVTVAQMEAINYRIRQVAVGSCSLETYYSGTTYEYYFNPPTLPQDPINAFYLSGDFEVYYYDGRAVLSSTEAGVESAIAIYSAEFYHGSPYEVGTSATLVSSFWSADPTSEFGIFASTAQIGGGFGKGIGMFVNSNRNSIGGSPYTAPTVGAYYTSNGNTDFPAAQWLQISLGPEVAFIDTTGSGDPLDPGNQLWLSAGISNDHTSNQGNAIQFSNNGAYADCGTFTLDLSGVSLGEVSCSLYLNRYGYTVTTALDIVATPSSWWPYKNQAGQPLWDEDTGASINGSFTD